ncbi:type VI secretion system protein TssA [Candidatus Contendibacter odensensis]|nr:type VI secretion system protein TssA [Candidatus Contendobacter odensis]
MSAIEIEQFLSQISAAEPCGENLEYDPVFVEMEKLAQGTPERQYGNTIIPAEPPNWGGIKKMALGLLSRTKDLRVAVYLTRALLYTDGLEGFRDGLVLLRGLIEQFWDEVHPKLDPDDGYDSTLRVNIVEVLIDPEETLRSLKEWPLVVSRVAGRFSYRDIQIAAGELKPIVAKDDKTPLPEQAMIDSAFQDVDLMELKGTADALAGIKENTQMIEALITERVGITQSANLELLRKLAQDMYSVVAGWLSRRGYVEPTVETAMTDDAETAGAVDATGVPRESRLVVGELNSREEVIRAIDKMCEYFSRYEPSSPVPFLLKRARRLMSKDFMEVLRDLAPGGTDHAKVILGLDETSAG